MRSPALLLLPAALVLAGCGPMILAGQFTTPGPARRHAAKLLGCDAKAAAKDAPFLPDVAVFADTQLDDYYGAGLITNSPLADRGTRVAVRPPALDLWSDVVLSAFARELTGALAAPSPAPAAGRAPTTVAPAPAPAGRAPLLLFLGDSTNVACTGELERFVRTLDEHAPQATWLMVPGNHETYMMGNFDASRRPAGLRASDTRACSSGPLDGARDPGPPAPPRAGDAPCFTRPRDRMRDPAISDSEYTAAEGRRFAYGPGTACESTLLTPRSWAGACAEPERESVPMYKGTWVRRYLEVLTTRAHVKLTLAPGGGPVSAGLEGVLNPAHCGPPRKIEGRGDDGSDLAARRYLLTGTVQSRNVYARDPSGQGGRCTPSSSENPSDRSYVVQSVDLSERVRAVLIDTDHRHWAVRTNLDLDDWAGEQGNVEPEQFDDLARHVAEARRRGQRIVLFTHHPLNDLPHAQAVRLLAEVDPLAFVSAHTHFESSVVTHDVDGGRFIELNVASTTDWPMQAMLLAAAPERLRWRVLGVQDPIEVGTAPGQPSACGYAHAAFAPRACDAWSRTRDTYLAYKDEDLCLRHHSLCRLRAELAQVSRHWPGDASPLRALGGGPPALPWPPGPGESWLPAAWETYAAVETLRAATREPGPARTFALCQAIGASIAEAQTRGVADTSVERSPRSQPAAYFPGVDFE